jgi:hypothetical protein
VHQFFSILLFWREPKDKEPLQGPSLQLPLCTTNHNNWEPTFLDLLYI